MTARMVVLLGAISAARAEERTIQAVAIVVLVAVTSWLAWELARDW